jgi:hypothetical protein
MTSDFSQCAEIDGNFLETNSETKVIFITRILSIIYPNQDEKYHAIQK